MLDIERERELEQEHAALDAYSTIVTTVAELVIPSVASLQVGRRLRNGRHAQGAGSAVAITPDGFLVTSAHVVEGTQRGVAALADGREFDIEIVGRDALSDLAVVRAKGSDLAAVEIGDAARLRVGELVVAVGNPMGLSGTATAGVAGGRRPLPPRAADRFERRFGVEIIQVVEGSPAAAAGLRAEDLILDVDDTPVEQPGDLQRLMISERIGREVCVRIFRNGEIF